MWSITNETETIFQEFETRNELDIWVYWNVDYSSLEYWTITTPDGLSWQF